jgi:hypothetical protein
MDRVEHSRSRAPHAATEMTFGLREKQFDIVRRQHDAEALSENVEAPAGLRCSFTFRMIEVRRVDSSPQGLPDLRRGLWRLSVVAVLRYVDPCPGLPHCARRPLLATGAAPSNSGDGCSPVQPGIVSTALPLSAPSRLRCTRKGGARR